TYLVRSKLPLQGAKYLPLDRSKLNDCSIEYPARLVRPAPRLQPAATNVPHTKRKEPLCPHDAEGVCANPLHQHLAVPLEGEALRNLESGPEPILRPGRFAVGGPDHDMP